MPDCGGPCWYCRKDACEIFSMEFDTPLHKECLIARVREDANDDEALIMLRELLNG